MLNFGDFCMNYEEVWNDICYRIKDKNQNVSESEFEIIVENIFERLGWSIRNEIITRKTIPIGSAGKSLIPDIIISKNNKYLFVVELKKPNNVLKEQNSIQLFSYMRQLKIIFGVLIGKTIQVYYDIPNANDEPKIVNETHFDMDLEDGIELIKLLSKNEFSTEKMDAYCKEKITLLSELEKEQKYIELICSEQGKNIINDILKEKLSLEFTEKSIASIISKINIDINCKQENYIDSFVDANKKNMEISIQKGKTMSKSQAMSLLSRKYGKTLNDNNTMYSTINAQVKQWSFNRQNDDFSRDIHMVLINQETRELHYFFIPENTIKNPHKIFDQRNDNFRQNCSKIYILLNSYNFKEKNSNFPFGDYKNETIKY